MKTWAAIVEKLDHLKTMDRHCAAFGAESHRYSFSAPISSDEISSAESKLGISLPDELKSFYREVGNGGAGPYYGLLAARALRGFQPAEIYPGVESLRQIASASGSRVDDNGYFEISYREIKGLVSIIDEGCGHQVCLVTTGPISGRVVNVSANGFVFETRKNLFDLYNEWLDRELELFESVQNLMNQARSYEQINEEMIARFKDYHADDRMASLADVPKPAELFGEGNTKRYHGASQIPWFKQVLKEWQDVNLESSD